MVCGSASSILACGKALRMRSASCRNWYATTQRLSRRFLYYQLYYSSLPFDTYLEEDGIWQGYVRLKDFDWQQLLP